MAELGNNLEHVVCHGESSRAFVLVPVEVNASEFFPVPVFCDGVKFLDGVTQIFGVSFTNILDSKITNDEAKGGGTPFVLP